MHSNRLQFGLYIAAAFMAGCSTAMYIVIAMQAPQYLPPAIVQAAEAPLPTVYIHGIYNQQLQGSTHGNVRVVLGDTALVLQPNTEFTVPAGPLLTHNIRIQIPAGMQFVASKNGKKYYSVHSKSAQRISPKNRVYFVDTITAEAAGYMP